jgi:hypothetical protein
MKLSNFMESLLKNIIYAEYKRQGFYIGSGHIEAGNKSVAEERLTRLGMMWNIDTS